MPVSGVKRMQPATGLPQLFGQLCQRQLRIGRGVRAHDGQGEWKPRAGFYYLIRCGWLRRDPVPAKAALKKASCLVSWQQVNME